MNEKSIAVSEIRQWSICPRQLYFKTGLSKKKQRTEEKAEEKTDEEIKIKKEIQRELLYELPEIVQNSIRKDREDDFLDNNKLKRQIEEMIKEISIEFEERRQGTKLPALISEKDTETQIETQIETLIENIHNTVDRNGFILYEIAAAPFKTEPFLYSEKLNIYGRPPKILIYEEKMLPYIIRTSKAPQNGIWESDRIQAAAYCMILEKEYGQNQISKYAVMDYVGDYRIFQVSELDKKKVFRAIRKIKDIKKGKMPAERNVFLCKSCRYREKCRPKMQTIFSRLFEKTGFK